MCTTCTCYDFTALGVNRSVGRRWGGVARVLLRCLRCVCVPCCISIFSAINTPGRFLSTLPSVALKHTDHADPKPNGSKFQNSQSAHTRQQHSVSKQAETFARRESRETTDTVSDRRSVLIGGHTVLSEAWHLTILSRVTGLSANTKPQGPSRPWRILRAVKRRAYGFSARCNISSDAPTSWLHTTPT